MPDATAPALRVLGPLDGRASDAAARPSLPTPTVREVIAATVIIVALAALLRLSFTLSGAIFDVFVALVLGTALRPVVDAVATRTGLARRLVAALLYALLLVVLGGIL